MIPQNPYSPAEIEAFVADNLHVIGKAQKREAALRKNFATLIARMPPWQQVILIESRRANITADQNTVQRLYDTDQKSGLSVLGFFQSGALGPFSRASRCADLPEFVMMRPSAWLAKQEESCIWTEKKLWTTYHENGHRLSFLSGEGDSVLSEDEHWQAAFEREVAYQKAQEKPRSALRRMLDVLTVFRRQKPLFALYEDCRSLVDHLSFYKADEHAEEALAEMNAHYASLYNRNNGQHNHKTNRIHRTMERIYPYLWPHYRTAVLPRQEKMAETLWQARQEALARHVETARTLYAEKNRPFHRTDTTRHCSLLMAAGLLPSAGCIPFVSLPLENHSAAQEQWAETRDALRRSYTERQAAPFVFNDEAALWENKASLLLGGHPEALQDKTLALVHKRQALNRYATLLDALEEAIANALGAPSTFIPGREKLERFDALMDMGGLEAVRAEIKRLETEGADTLENYITARIDRAAAQKTHGNLSHSKAEDGLFEPLHAGLEELSDKFGATVRRNLSAWLCNAFASNSLSAETQILRAQTDRIIRQTQP